MKNYEYKVIDDSVLNLYETEAEKQLNQLGKEGWQLVSADKITHKLIFMREKRL